jgi:hypothetical protein
MRLKKYIYIKKPAVAQPRQQQSHGRVPRRVRAAQAQDALPVREQARRADPRRRVRGQPEEAAPVRQRLHRAGTELHHVARAPGAASLQERPQE